MKATLQSKTIWAAVIVGALAIIDQLTGGTMAKDHPTIYAYALIAKQVFDVINRRYFTSTTLVPPTVLKGSSLKVLAFIAVLGSVVWGSAPAHAQTTPPDLTPPTSVSITEQFNFKHNTWATIALGPSAKHYHYDDILGFRTHIDFDFQPILGEQAGDGLIGGAFTLHWRPRGNVGVVAGWDGFAIQNGRPQGAFIIGIEVGAQTQ